MTSKNSFQSDFIAQDVLKQTCNLIRQHSIEFPDTGALCKRLMRRIKEKFPPCTVRKEDNITDGVCPDSDKVEIERLLRKIHKENEKIATFPFDIGFTLGAEEERIFEMTFSVLKRLVEETRITTREEILRIWSDSKKNFSVLRTITEFAVAAPSKVELLVELVKAIASEEIPNFAMYRKVVTYTVHLAVATTSVCTQRITDFEQIEDFGIMMSNMMGFVGNLCLNQYATSTHVDDYMTLFFDSYSVNPVKSTEVLIRSAVRLLIICGHCVDKRVVEKAMVRMRNVVNRVDEGTRTQINKLETLMANGWR